MTLPPIVLDGWFVLHQFFRVDRLALEDGEAAARRERAEGVASLFAGWEDLGEEGWSGLYRVVGGGSDYLAVHFRHTLDALGDTERAVRLSPHTQDLELAHDYVSVVELGLYALTKALLEKAEADGIEVRSAEWDALVEETLADERQKAYTQRRLKPRQPEDMPYVCFYPMDKRRAVGQNWYTLGLGERADLMQDHGTAGRRYAGKVSQVISGSVGFDDWEWAVTLFSGDPLHFKSLVTEMRYDRASSVYAEFGRFWVGHRVPSGAIAEELAPAE